MKRDDLKVVRQRKYLARDFDSLRSQLLEYARLYYSDKIKDFSENSMGGILLDLAAYVGDNLSFYLDHQYGELNPNTAVETVNVERLIKNAGVPIVGASPSIVPVTMYVQVPAERVGNSVVPNVSTLPIVHAGSVFSSTSGIDFVLIEDVNFNSRRSDGTFLAEIRIGQKSTLNVPTTFIMALSGLCISGKETTETFSIGQTFVPFRRITLSNANVSDIVSVVDGYGNTYYEVGALTHDVVYTNVVNAASDSELVNDVIKVVPAPYRYTAQGDLATRKTIITFGGGSANTLEDDIIPDPADFAIPFQYKKTFSRTSINPQQLLRTKTLGVAATNTTLQITYRYGGGLQHNVPENNIRTVKTLKMTFPGGPTAAVAAQVRGSIEVTNRIEAAGGEDAPSSDDLKDLIPTMSNSQSRVVTAPDLLARVYTMPSNFGRVFRAAVRSNPYNPLATQLFIVSRDQDSRLIVSPDTLKKNLKSFLQPYRMISDAIDIIDARVVNLIVKVNIVIDPLLNRSIVMQQVLTKLQKFFNIKNANIDQPITVSDVTQNVFSTPGVVSVSGIKFECVSGLYAGRTYSNENVDVGSLTRHNIITPPPGGIFEIRYPEHDIICTSTV